MARALSEERLARDVLTSLQAVSCPLVEDLELQDPDSILQLLCTPSQHRSDIFAWICCRIKPNLRRSGEPEALWKEAALLGQELMLCRAADQDLLREASASIQRQLGLLQQLLTLVPGSTQSSGSRRDSEMLLSELCAAENVSQLSHMLTPTLDPWPSHSRRVPTASRASSRDVCSLLQQTCGALQQLQAQCDFLEDDTDPSRAGFSPSSLHVAAGDLRQLMAAFSHVYEADLRLYCCREPPSFNPDAHVFQRTQQLLKAFITELEVLKEVPAASQSTSQEVEMLQTQPSYHTGGSKCTFDEQLEQLISRVRDVSILLPS